MTIVVTGASGHLGRLAVEALLARGVPPTGIVATARDPEAIAGLGVPARRADYGDPASLAAAFAGADRLLFVSGSEVGKRVAQHRNVVDAARSAGVGHVFYTSAPRADTTDMKLAAEHRETERMLLDSGVPSTFLRNGWYFENYDLTAALDHGLFGAAGDGRISAAARADLAEAAAAAVLNPNPRQVYELGGTPFTLTQLADAITRASGRTVTYTDLPVEKYTELLLTAGLPEAYATILADSDRAASAGALQGDGTDLPDLLGRTPTTLDTYLRDALR